MDISIFSLFSFTVLSIYLSLGFYVFSLKPESTVNRIFILLSISFAIWALTFTFFYSAPNKQTAWFWYNISALGRFFYPAVLLHIALVFTKNRSVKKWYNAIIIYIPTLIFLYGIFTGPFITQDLVLVNSQWYEILITNNGWWFAYNSYYILYDLIAITLIGWWGYRSTHLREKKQSLVIVLTGSLALILGTLTNTVLQALNIYVLPSIAQIFGVIFFLGIGFAIIRYQLLNLTPAIAAEQIVSKITDLVILIDIDSKIIKINYRAQDLLGYSEQELLGKEWSSLIQNPTDLKLARDRMDKTLKESPKHDKSYWSNKILELTYKSKHGEIPVKSFLSVIKDKYSVVGFVLVGQDMRQTRKLQHEIIEREKAEKSVKDHAQNLEILNRIIKIINKAPDLPSLLRETINSALLISKYSGGGVYLFDDDNIAHLKCVENLIPEFVDKLKELEAQKNTVKTLINKPRFISGVYSEFYFINPFNSGFNFVGFIPLLSQDKLIGYISLFSGDEVIFSTGQIEIMESMGREVGASINRLKTEDTIKKSLKEKELLLKEIHHRVKNNMQIISSLLNLQASYIKDKEAVDALNECQGRIMSMAMIHEKLYQSGSLSGINFSDYIKSLVSDLIYSYTTNFEDINVNMDANEVILDIDTAIPCGLIINELVTNSIKHAFPGNKKGNIFIHMQEVENDEYLLVVGDDGVGLPRDLDVTGATTLGLLLVSTLVNQLEGNLKIDRTHGTIFNISFMKLDYNQRV